jgi:hypothetical protein
MPENEEVTPQLVLAEARIVGLPLTEAEAEEMVNGVRRIKAMMKAVQALVDASAEPAPTFDAGNASRKSRQ